ncbi:MAG: BMC domain-containing protein [Acidobacteriota bacterium]
MTPASSAGPSGAAPTAPALLLLELVSIARGLRVADAIAKRTPLATLAMGTMQPGNFLILAAGEVAEVEEALVAAEEHGSSGGRAGWSHVLLPGVAPQVIAAAAGHRASAAGDTLGVVETADAPSVLAAADAAVKEAPVELVTLRFGDGLGGRGYFLLTGELADIEAAVAAAQAAVSLSARRETAVIPRTDELLRQSLAAADELAPGLRLLNPAGAR